MTRPTPAPPVFPFPDHRTLAEVFADQQTTRRAEIKRIAEGRRAA